MKTKTKEIMTSDKPLSYKIKYFWEYNNKIILFILFCLVVAGSMIYEMTHKDPPPELTITVVGDNESLVKLQSLKKKDTDLMANLVTNEDKYQVDFISQDDGATRQRYIAQLAAAEIDLIICNEKEYAQLKKDDGLVDLKKLASPYQDLVEAEEPYGLSITKLDTKLDQSLQNYRLCIPVNVKEPQKIMEKLEKLE